jgi:hypothetical protein
MPAGESVVFQNILNPLFDLHGKGQTIQTVHIPPSGTESLTREFAQQGRHCYLRFEVLRV